MIMMAHLKATPGLAEVAPETTAAAELVDRRVRTAHMDCERISTVR
jgi:hypothetical protein